MSPVLARVDVRVDVEADGATFLFTPPVSIIVLMVSNKFGKVVWQVTAREARKAPATEDVVIGRPSAGASRGMLEMVRLAEARFKESLRERGPSRPPVDRVLYGVVPEGYRQEAPARTLSTGDYEVEVMAEQGHGESRFSRTS